MTTTTTTMKAIVQTKNGEHMTSIRTSGLTKDFGDLKP